MKKSFITSGPDQASTVWEGPRHTVNAIMQDICCKGLTANMQVRNEFCQVDKISTRTCIFDDAEIL